MNKTRLISIVVAAIIAAVFGTGQFNSNGNNGPTDSRSQPAGKNSDGNAIVVGNLPSEAQQVLKLIYQGGPFRYKKDGTVFQNREGRLPEKKRGFYREYTVRTPGVKTRGARRIVAGGPRKQPSALYYTEDHYKSFLRIQGAGQQ